LTTTRKRRRSLGIGAGLRTVGSALLLLLLLPAALPLPRIGRRYGLPAFWLHGRTSSLLLWLCLSLPPMEGKKER
jgi:hypothetical protein